MYRLCKFLAVDYVEPLFSPMQIVCFPMGGSFVPLEYDFCLLFPIWIGFMEMFV